MPHVEVSLPKKVDSEIDRLVDEGEFINRDQAIEGLISRGISVHDAVVEPPSEMNEDVFTQAIDDQQDPAMENVQQNEEYNF